MPSVVIFYEEVGYFCQMFIVSGCCGVGFECVVVNICRRNNVFVIITLYSSCNNRGVVSVECLNPKDERLEPVFNIFSTVTIGIF